MKAILTLPRLLSGYLLLLLSLLISDKLKAQIWPDSENFELLGSEVLQQTNGIRYKTVTQGSGKQLVFMQSVPGQQDGTTWGYVGIPGSYFNGYPTKALMYNYDRAQDGSANPSVGGYGIYRMLFSEAPLNVTGQTIDTLSKLGNFRLKSIYVALGRNFGTESAVPSAVLLNFHGLRNGVSLVRPFITMRSGAENSGPGSIVSEQNGTILTYSAMDKHGGRTFTFVSDEWDFIDGLWISTAGTARLPVLVDNIQFEAPSPVPPNVRSTNLAITAAQPHEATLRWQNGGSTLNRGSWRLLLIKETDDEDELPSSPLLVARPDEIPAVIPRRSSSPGEQGLVGAYGAPGTDLGDGWYCVYNDSHSNFPLTVTGLSPGKRYRAVVADYHGAKGFQTFMENPFIAGQNAITFRTPSIPTVELSTTAPTLVNAPFTVTTTFSEAVTGLSLGDFESSNATFSELQTQDDITYQVLVTPTTDGDVSIRLPENVVVSASDVGNSASNLLTVNYDGTAPIAPQGVGATSGDTEVSLSWAANTEDDLVGYRIYAGTTTNPTDMLTMLGVGETAYTHTGLTNGTLYYYRITAVDLATNESVYSEEVSARPMAEQAITFDLQDEATYGDEPITLMATATSDLPVVYTSSDANIASVDGNTLTIHSVGTVTITVEQPGNEAFLPADPVQQQLTINPASLTIIAEDKNKVYGEPLNFAGTEFTVLGLKGDDEVTSVTLTATGSTATADLGSYEIDVSEASGKGLTNYAISYVNGTLTVTPAAITGLSLKDTAFIYDGTKKTLSVSGDLPAGITVSYTINGEEGNGAVDAGIYHVIATVSGTNYTTKAYEATLTIRKAQPVITAAAVQTYVYDGSPKAVLASVTPEQLDSQLQYSPQGSFTNVGEHRIRVYLNESANYLATEAWIDFSITPAAQLGLRLPNLTVTYNGEAHALEVQGVPADAEVSYSGNGKVNAGSHTVQAVVRRPNHTDTTLVGTLYINKAPAVITTTAMQEQLFDGSSKSVEAMLSHAETDLTYSPQQAYIATGTYTVTISAGETENYHAVSATVTLRILPARQTNLSMPDRTAIYTGQPRSLSVHGLTEDATVTYTGNGQTETGEHEVRAVVSRPEYSDTTLVAVLTIARATAFVLDEENQEHIYDGEPKALVAALSHDETELSFDPSDQFVNAGTYRVTVSASQTRNYEAVSKTFTLRIAPAARTLDFPSLPEKAYGDADFSGHAATSTGEPVFYSSDNASVAEIVDGLIRITGVGSTTITATVPENSNYSNKPQISRTLVVHKATQTISFAEVGEVSRDAGSVQLDVSANSGLPIGLEVSDEQVATLNGTVLNIHRLGTVLITATQEGDSNHEAAEPVTITVRVVDPSSSFPVRVHQAVSPNGDGINEFLMIEGIRDYRENRVQIVNRNGTIVWEAAGYDNDRIAFRGIGAGQLRLPAGTYFYIVEVKNTDGRWGHHKGYFVLRY